MRRHRHHRRMSNQFTRRRHLTICCLRRSCAPPATLRPVRMELSSSSPAGKRLPRGKLLDISAVSRAAIIVVVGPMTRFAFTICHTFIGQLVQRWQNEIDSAVAAIGHLCRPCQRLRYLLVPYQ